MTGSITNFFCAVCLSSWVVFRGIAHPGFKRDIRELYLSSNWPGYRRADIAQPDRLHATPVGEDDISESRTKRLRNDDIHRAESGNIFGFGIRGGRQARSPPVELRSDPTGLVLGNDSQEISHSEPIDDVPINPGNDSANDFDMIKVFSHDHLREDRRYIFKDLDELDTFLNSPIGIYPDDCQSTAQAADTDGQVNLNNFHFEVRTLPNQGQLQLHPHELNPNCFPGTQLLELPGINQGTQNLLNYFPSENEKFSRGENYNYFLHGNSNVLSSPSPLDHRAPIRSIEFQGESTCNHNQSEAFQDLSSLPPPSSILGYIRAAQKSMLAEQHGPTVFRTVSPLLDVKLQNLKVSGVRCPPKGSISASALEEYVLPYKVNIDEVLGNCPKRPHVIYTNFQGIYAVEVTHYTLQVPIIRVQGEARDIRSPSQLLELFRQLLKWLLFNHEAFLNAIPISEDERPDFHQGLMNWLETEIFRPYESLPVVGWVKSEVLTYTRNDFGPVQRKVIDYLSSRTSEKSTCDVSAALIGIWYRNFYLKKWWDGASGGKEAFSKFMSESIQHAKKLQITIDHQSNVGSNMSEDLIGNFKICHSRNLSYISPKRFRFIPLQTPTSFEDFRSLSDTLINQIHMTYSQHQISHCVKKKTFHNIPAALVEETKKDNDQLRFNVIRMLDPLNKVLTPAFITRKVNYFLDKFFIYHTILTHALQSGRLRGNIETACSFIEWFHNKCFSFEDGLPVFGVLERKTVIEADNPFGEFQSYLIKLLQKISKSLCWDRSAIAILGYWFKKELKGFWEENWGEDERFWEFISNELRIYNTMVVNQIIKYEHNQKSGPETYDQ